MVCICWVLVGVCESVSMYVESVCGGVVVGVCMLRVCGCWCVSMGCLCVCMCVWICVWLSVCGVCVGVDGWLWVCVVYVVCGWV